MSEAEAAAQVTEAPAAEQSKPEVAEKPRFSREDWDHMQREKASKNGWKDFDDYIAEGGDPEKWKTADAFNQYGDLMSTLRRKDQEFNQRLEGVQKLSAAQLEAQRIELTARRDAAIEEGKVKEVHALDKQINNLNVPMPQASNAFLDNWNAENPWIFEDSPKAIYAKAEFNKAIAAGKDVQSAVSAVEAAVKKHFAPTPIAKPAGHVPEGEKGRSSVGSSPKTQALTMADLNDEEKLAWKHMGHAWKNEQEFLKAAADMRKAAKGGR